MPTTADSRCGGRCGKTCIALGASFLLCTSISGGVHDAVYRTDACPSEYAVARAHVDEGTCQGMA
eukprot:6383502-Heterocapsa_arctica.AAC.1